MKNEDPFRRRRPSSRTAADSSLDAVRAQLDALKAEYVASDMKREGLVLGARMKRIINEITSLYVAAAGDNARSRQFALKYAYNYIRDIFHFSHSKIRLHVNVFDKFHLNSAAMEHLCLTDMQLLLAREIGDDIVDAVIQLRKDNPRLSTREVKDLISAMRPQPPLGRDETSPGVGVQA